MTPHSRANIYLGLGCIAFAALVAFVWVPLDVDSGLVEKVRRRLAIGDALAPTVAAVFIGVGGLVLVLVEGRALEQARLRFNDLVFVALALSILVAGFLIMLYAGPVAVALFASETEYRLLRDTVPWKYIGFFLGGVFILVGLITPSENGFRLRTLWVAIAVVLVLILIYDVPFEDLLLPPNGDV